MSLEELRKKLGGAPGTDVLAAFTAEPLEELLEEGNPVYIEDRIDELEDQVMELQGQISILKERVDALERNQNRNPERPSERNTPDPGTGRGSEVGRVGGVDDGLSV